MTNVSLFPLTCGIKQEKEEQCNVRLERRSAVMQTELVYIRVSAL